MTFFLKSIRHRSERNTHCWPRLKLKLRLTSWIPDSFFQNRFERLFFWRTNNRQITLKPGFHTIASIAEKKTSAIVVIIWKLLSRDSSDRSDHINRNDHWNYFFSGRSDRSDHMETGFQEDPPQVCVICFTWKFAEFGSFHSFYPSIFLLLKKVNWTFCRGNLFFASEWAGPFDCHKWRFSTSVVASEEN